MKRVADDSAPESDRYEDYPHPRETHVLFGHEEAERELLDAYREQRLHHAWLIGGPQGIGKATLAWRMTKFLLANPDPTSTKVQAAHHLSVPESNYTSKQVEAHSHSDLALLRREWNDKTKKHFTEIRVDDVRSALNLFHHTSGSGGYRVCLVDCADDLNRSSANALLKVIEEPPPRSIFFIVAHNAAHVLPTIRSRCRKLLLKPLSDEALFPAVRAAAPELEAGDIRHAAERARGSVREALRLMSGSGVQVDQQVNRILNGLPKINWDWVHDLADQVTSREQQNEFDVMVGAVYDWLDATVHARAGEGASRLAPFAEVWEKVAADVRETEALNLDKRAFTLLMFDDIVAAAESAQR